METRIVNTVSTKSIQTAAFLIARGHSLVKAATTGNSTFFYFPDTPAVYEDAEAMQVGADEVSARKLFNARNYLLSIVHGDEGVRR